MQNKVNTKKARAVIVTIALIVATNFAISRAESVPQPAPRTSSSFAADALILPSAPRPSNLFAADALIWPSAPRPSNLFAADACNYQWAPRPSSSLVG